MDAVKNLITNVPNWIQRLDELQAQVDKRQIELAEVAAANALSSPDSDRRSLRNRGSTESLKPRDEDPAHPPPHPAEAALPRLERAPSITRRRQPQQNGELQPPSSPLSASEPHSPSALLRQGQNIMAEVRAKARATVRKRQRTDSVISAEGATAKYRTRSLIIVYYDSYVQAFFEELVKFVSASRNMMRKAKVAAKVAHIKRLAELEMPDSNGVDGAGTGVPGLDAPLEASPAADDKDGEKLPQLHYVSTRQMRTVARSPDSPLHAAAAAAGLPRAMITGGAGLGFVASSSRLSVALGESGGAGGAALDQLDKALEYVQGMCEHGAHQFLRDGDCAEEIANIQRRLAEVKALADAELERVQREDPDALTAPPPGADQLRMRSFRPHSMRRDMLGLPLEAAKDAELEVDEGISDMDVTPKLVYKSTRMMGVRHP